MSTTESQFKRLITMYEEAAGIAKSALQEKTEIWDKIKEMMGDEEEHELPGYGSITFHYDKDKEVVEFDREAFKKAEPKLYKKYVSVKIVQGARRLVLHPREDE